MSIEDRAPAPPLRWREPSRTLDGDQARSTRRGDLVELAVLALFATVGVWTIALHVWYVVAQGARWTGAFGMYLVDPLQYMAWMRDASRHVLVSNLFVLHPTPHDYLEPVAAISGVAVALGAAPWMALLAWEFLAFVAVLAAVSAFVHRQLFGKWQRRAALALALFGGWLGLHVDLWLPFWAWGYPIGLLALACALGSLLCYGRARAAGQLPWLAALLAALASWLHPWQGEVTILAMLGGEALMWAQGRRSRLSGVLMVAVVGALPLGYYALLPVFDASWRLAGKANVIWFPFSMLAPLAPLALGAALAYRRRPRTFLAAATRAWPLAAIVVLEAAERGLGSAPAHALLGISVPLGVLAAEGVGSLRWPSRTLARLSAPTTVTPARPAARSHVPTVLRGLGFAAAAAAVGALTIPVTVAKLKNAAATVKAEYRPTADDQRAAAYLARVPEPGGVIANAITGVFIPAATGRHTYVGHCTWSLPGCQLRNTQAWLLLDWGHWDPGIARPFVRGENARFLLQDCRSHASVAEIKRELGPLIGSVHRFGCAHVYTIDRSPRGRGH